MKTRLFPFFFILFVQSGFGQTAPALGCFEHFRQEGENAVHRRRPNYELARKKFAAAKECPEADADQQRLMDERIRDVEAKNLSLLEKQIDKAEESQALAEARAIEADKLRDEAGQALQMTKTALAEAEKRRLESEAATRHALANDLAFRAQTALRDGDRTTAFRLAELVWKYVEHGNLRAQQAILDVFYQNDKTSDKCPLPWRTHNFLFDEGDTAEKVQFSDDTKLLAVATTMGSVYVWELATGNELFFLPKQSVSGSCAFSSDCQKIAVSRKTDEISVFSLKNDVPPINIPCTGSSTLWNLLFSPDNQQVSTVKDDGSLQVFSTKTGAAITKLGGESGQLLTTLLSFDQKTLLFIGDDGQFEVIDVERGKRQSAFSTGNPYPLAVSFSLDGKLVAVSCADRSMGIWRAADGVKLLGFAPQALAATTLYFSNDAKTLTSTYSNNDAKNWDVGTGMELKIDRENITETYYELQVSPDGKLKSVSSFDRGLEVFDNMTGRKLFSRPNFTEVSQFVFSPDSRMILLAHLDGSAELIDSDKGKLRFSFPVSDEILGYFFSPDGQKIAFSRMKGSVDIFDLNSNKALSPKPSMNFSGLSGFSPDSRSVAIPMIGDSLKIVDAKTGATRFAWNDRGLNFLFLNENRILSWGAPDNLHFSVSDLTTGKIVAKGNLLAPSEGLFFQGFDGGSLIVATYYQDGRSETFDAETGKRLPACTDCYSYKVSADGKLAVFQYQNLGTGHVIDRATGAEIRKIAPEGESFLAILSFSPDNKRLLCLEFGTNTGLIYDLEPNSKPIELRDETLQISNLFWSGDGKKVHSGNSYFSQWDALTGKLETSTYLSASRISFSKSGDRAASMSSPREVTIWDMAKGRPLFTLRGHTKDIIDQVFSEKSNRILTSSSDQTARIWDIGNGREMLRLQADTFDMGRAQFSPDGKLATIWQNGSPAIWQLDADSILHVLNKKQLFAALSPEQIYDFNIEEPLRPADVFNKVLMDFSPLESLELARFYLNQGFLEYDLDQFQTSFSRAEQLFIHALNASDRPSIAIELSDLYTEWAKKLLDNGLKLDAKLLAEKVERLSSLVGGMDAKSKLQLAFAQAAVGNQKAATDIYQKLVDEKTDLPLVKAALDESTRIFGKSNGYKPILEQVVKQIAADSISQFAPLDDNARAIATDSIPADTDWPEQVKLSREELRSALRNNLAYGFPGAAQDVTSLMGNLSFYLLFVKKFDEARQFAELGLMIDTSQVFMKTNLAHAHLFSGQTERARELYKSLTAMPDPGNPPNTFRETLLLDFEQFSEAGLRSKDLPKMVELVSGQKLGQKERLKYLPQ